MAKRRINLSGDIELSYDENSEEFKQALSDYREVIDNHGEVEDMLKHVAYNITRFGHDHMVEGVGYVSVNGERKEPDSGIEVNSDYDLWHFEVM